MPPYLQRGKVPRKRHIAFRRENGGIYYEELIGNQGFRGPSTLMYRLNRPTEVSKIELVRELKWEMKTDPTLRPYHFRLGRLGAKGDAVLDRVPVVMNHDVAMTFSRPERTAAAFYRNGQGDELVYVVDGEGRVESALGSLAFGPGDYLVIPRGLVHRLALSGSGHRFVIFESTGPVRVPARYRNENGQMVEGAPYSERDMRFPERLETHDETGEFEIQTKMRDAITRHVVRGHPFDVVGWDGTYYPWAFNIRDFEPVVGAIHQPPPVHQTFEGIGFVICSFVPRLFDFYPDAVPAPYNHSNAQSEEVLFYASAEFMSRKGIELASVTYHPDGMPHGPQPGMTEASIGAKKTDELAVMMDTFRPLHVAKAVLDVDDDEYPRSWLG
ncbi:MAG TPA: homogentisate 1,2-dioxygenase [Candidatus Eisenbacteria bacterium]|nr:homogentisate 1,2-dioxygenase [Candidatus Eisenbacteria bacterium]